jgi:D-glycero-alpha-D-manno-heptose-7-phosphate kinase
MIITRSPLRISLGGGGTDVPAFYREHGGGFLVAAAISKYVYIAVHRNFDDDLIIKYSKIERVDRAEDIQHPILREALVALGITGGLEISSMADIPAGTGLGSSGAFTVGLLKALQAHQHRMTTNEELAALASDIEISRLREPVGKQDQYAAAIGGLTGFHFHPDDTVSVEPLVMPLEARLRLEEDLLLFYTGVRRSASDELSAQFDGHSDSGATVEANLRLVRSLGLESHDALRAGDLKAFAELMTQQWKLKLDRARTPLHESIDQLIEYGLSCGALGGKLVGAGGGGFLLFYADAKSDLRLAMAERGLEEVRFSFDYEGSKVLVT